MADFPEIGLEAVIENLNNFSKAANRIVDSYDAMDKGATTVEKTSFGAGSALTGMAGIMAGTVVVAAAAAAAAIGSVVVGIVALGKASIETGKEYTKSMSNVQAISGATAEEFETLSAAAEELGSTTKFTAAEAAEGMSFLAMAGFEVNDIISAMPGVLDLAAAGNLDLATSADIVSNIVSGMGADVSETSKFVDILTKTMTTSNTNLIQLGEGMKFVAPIAADLGIDVADVSAAMGVLADSGIQATMGGTALRASLLRLSAPTKVAKETMDELGITVFNSAGELEDLPTIIGRVEEATKHLTEEQRIQALTNIFGQRNVAAFSILMKKGEADLRAYGNELRDSVGTASDIAATQLDNLSGDLTLLGSAFDGIKIQIFKELEPLLRNIAKLGARVLEFLGPQLVKVYDKLAAAAGPLIDTIGGKLIQAFEIFFGSLEKGFSIAGAFKNLFIEFLPPELLEPMFQFQDAIRNLIDKIFPDFKSAAEGTGSIFQNILANAITFLATTILPTLTKAIQFITDNWDDWVNFVKNTVIPTLINIAKFIVNDVIPAIGQFAGWIQTTLIPALSQMWTWFSVNILPLITRIFQLFSQDGQQAGTIMAQIWTNINEKIQPLINIALPKILELFEIIKTWTIANWPLIQQTIVTIIGFINDIIIAKLTVLQNFWNTWGDTIVSVTSFVFNFIFKIIKKRIKTILKILTVFMKIITGDWEEVWMDALKLLDETWKSIKTAIESALKIIQTTISTTMQQVKNVMIQIWNDIKTAISTKWNEIINTVTSKINQMINTIISVISGAVSDIAGSLIDTVKDALKLLGKAVESGGKLFKKLLEIGEDIIDSIADGFEKATDFAKDLIKIIKEELEKVVRAGSDVLAAAISIGTEIINGIIQGIEDAKQTLKDMLEDVSGLIPDWLADFLGIGSPAKLTIPIGRRIGEGIAVGIAQSGDLIRAAAEGIVAPVSLTTTPIPASAAATGAVTNNFNFGGNTINTQVDNAQFEARVMDVIRRNL